MEEWKEILEYKGYYQVSNLGRVRSLPRTVLSGGVERKRIGKLLKQCCGTDGYMFVRLSIKGKAKYWRVHRLVAIHFIANPEKHPVVNHLDADVTNNQVCNLQWCTIKENNKHTYRLGRDRHASGSGHHASIINEIKARAIKHLLKTEMSMTDIATAIDTTYHVVNAIKQRRTWKNS